MKKKHYMTIDKAQHKQDFLDFLNRYIKKQNTKWHIWYIDENNFFNDKILEGIENAIKFTEKNYVYEIRRVF